jgi:hypothetical protein
MNGVKVARMARGLMKKEVLAACKIILTPHRLNQIEAGKGWWPRDGKRIALTGLLSVVVEVLFAPGLQIDITYGLGRKPKVQFINVD